MATPFYISTYITGWSIPIEEKQAESWLDGWQGQHARDHQNIFSALNSLQVALGNDPYQVNQSELSFEKKDIESINNFLFNNRREHSEFYGWLNQLGAALAQYAKPPIIVYPKMNITGPVLDNSLDMWSIFMGGERVSHMLTLSAINQIYAAYQGITP